MPINKLSKCLVLAPHLMFPTRNGGDILIDRRWAEFSRYITHVDIVTHDRVIRYEQGACTSVTEFRNQARSKLFASVRTALCFSHYLTEKFITGNFKHVAKQYLLDPSYEMVVCSLISTASLVDTNAGEKRLYCVETQNDEIMWFANMRRLSWNPMIKWVAWLSERWLIRFIQHHETSFLYLHVSKQDHAGYAVNAPKHFSYIAPVGCDLDDTDTVHEIVRAGRPIRLLFAGSLSVAMNFDAIDYFSKRFEPVLRQGLPEGLEVRIVGSNPTAQVMRLCASKGWELRENVAEEELAACYSWADFSILPFSYATGGKLKLLKSLSLGVPFLATNVMADQLGEVPYPSLVADNPEDWLNHVRKVQQAGITQLQREQLKFSAEKYSWRNIADNLYHHLCSIS